MTAPCALVIAVVVWWAIDGGGFDVRLWAPGTLLVLGALLGALSALPPAWGGAPSATRVATVALISYGLWSFASILWADDAGAALEGATRTSLYVAAFCLFALWPQRGSTGAALLGAWVGGLTIVGGVVAVRLLVADDPGTLFGFDRLEDPTGYPNATAALLMMPALAAVVLAAARAVPWWMRGFAATAAVGLVGLAVLTLSRGAAYTTPFVLLVLLAIVPGRVRHFYALLGVAGALALVLPRLLDVSEAAVDGTLAEVLPRALVALGVVALGAGVLTAGLARAAMTESVARAAPPARLAARIGVGVVLALGIGAAAATVGDPKVRLESAWSSFKGGYEDNDQGANRLVGGLGSARYDFYRVGLDTWADAPLVGAGADNFYQQYLRSGTSDETPRYPHSVEVRTLAQTGLVGAVFLLVAIAAALVAASQAMRTGGGPRRTAAQGATVAFLYWLGHGSVDWFWEWGGLGLPAFVLLGLACGLGPRSLAADHGVAGRRAPKLLAAAAVLVVALPAMAVWSADALQRRAGERYADDPLGAYADLERAARLNPLAATPETLAGSIALRYEDLPRADAAFGRALDRVPNDAYASLERGAIASARGDRERALTELRRTVVLAPRDELAREALAVVRRGEVIDVTELNRRILSDVVAFSP